MKTTDIMKLSNLDKLAMIDELSNKIYNKYLKLSGNIGLSEWLRDEDLDWTTQLKQEDNPADYAINVILHSKLKMFNKRKVNIVVLEMQYNHFKEETEKYLSWKKGLNN